MRYIIPISGKDSAATAVVQMARQPDLPYEFLFCDVKMELPETYAWIARLEEKLGIDIRRIGRSLEDVIIEQNMLPSITVDSARSTARYSRSGISSARKRRSSTLASGPTKPSVPA